MRLLLLSNSTNPGEDFLSYPAEAIRTFLGDAVGEVLFVPYAAVRLSFDDYAARVRERFEAWGYGLQSLHEAADPKAAVERAEAVVVGGGNTFHLVRALHQARAVEAVRERVRGGAPYVGWSAGANVACPTLRTTNDMPIVEPPSFRTFGFVPFQINPHYTDAHPAGHGGETRDERLAEFVAANPEVYVVGLREGTWLRVENDRLALVGPRPARVFKGGDSPREYDAGADLAFLLDPTPTSGRGHDVRRTARP